MKQHFPRLAGSRRLLDFGAAGVDGVHALKQGAAALSRAALGRREAVQFKDGHNRAFAQRPAHGVELLAVPIFGVNLGAMRHGGKLRGRRRPWNRVHITPNILFCAHCSQLLAHLLTSRQVGTKLRTVDRETAMKYRGFSIERETDGTYSLYNLGYVAGGFASIEAAQRDADKRRD